MELFDVIEARRSVRTFSDRDVEPEKIERVLEAARLAPSWKNLQCWSFVVVTDRAAIENLATSGALGGNTWARRAPVLIVACGDPAASGDRYGIPYYAVDVAIALQQLVLAATDLGLGTCWIGVFEEPKVRSALGIPQDQKIVALTPLGYPSERMGAYERAARAVVQSKKRRALSDIVHYERW